MLLEANADVNAQGGKFGNALQAASYRGDKEMKRLKARSLGLKSLRVLLPVAVDSTPDDHPSRAARLYDLGNRLPLIWALCNGVTSNLVRAANVYISSFLTAMWQR
ncbi:hypothetical protein MKZ38_002687 [Zalerion maritima]|uniref:Uncharacterized protein n=1 Tax=Zalerion maritima TaxID=339359 RepID=A0AAD5RNL6_9PEZI|nr:hypothetical protein MKZ38_002687 [Zalerion maritima]